MTADLHKNQARPEGEPESGSGQPETARESTAIERPSGEEGRLSEDPSAGAADQNSKRMPLSGEEPKLSEDRSAAGAGSAAGWNLVEAPLLLLLQALGFGIVFGFLLQKGGAAKFDLLIGALLLENFVIVKIMLSAIIVGIIGVYLLEQRGLLQRDFEDAKYAANAVGGLLFGIGFALLAYCPGTNAAAIGQGNLDALTGVLGLICGSYLYALTSAFSGKTIEAWGNRGPLTLPKVFGISHSSCVPWCVSVLLAALLLLELIGY